MSKNFVAAVLIGGIVSGVVGVLFADFSAKSTPTRVAGIPKGGDRRRRQRTSGGDGRRQHTSKTSAQHCRSYPTHRCNEDGAPEGYKIVAVRGRGSCLYHAVAHGWVAQGRTPFWETGPCGEADRAGHGASGLRSRVALHLQGLSEDAHCSLLAHATQDVLPCVESGRLELLRRINVHSKWAHYEEVALLANLLNAIIVVYISSKKKRVEDQTVMVGPDGRSATGDAAGVEQARDWGYPRDTIIIPIINANSKHFDALVPCDGTWRGGQKIVQL